VDENRYPGAKALAELHEIHLRSFLAEWRAAKANQLTLPETDDRAYRSLETLLWHVLSCACRYLSWTTDALDLPPPVLPELPDEDAIADEADRLLEDILEAWRLPLWEQPLKAFVSGEHKAWWGTGYCVDAMLEHAVMHPLRHRWQLEKLAGGAGRPDMP
jgi:uncharacterized damage-inducible protein DinB